MTTTEKLNAIKSKCEELLRQKRTAGKWEWNDSAGICIDGEQSCQLLNLGNAAKRKRDGKFIAACAGNAEAGWRATIAAIEGLSQPMPEGCCHPDNPVNLFDHQLADKILAAWEGLV